MDRARQAASWEGELERGSTELVGKLSGRWICGMGQEGQQVGKIIAWQFQEEEVDRRVTGRISKDLETFKQESGWGRGECRRGHTEAQAGLCREVALWLCGESRALEMPCQHSLACISFLPATQLRIRRDG